MAEEESPLVKALPPETDYISYLTIVEHYLSEDNLPILHKVLQDDKLATNIGWDLVNLLVPMLPASEQCLQDIARLGNPREVILKVTESLRLIDYEGLADPEDVEDDTRPGALMQPLKTAPVEDGNSRPGSSQAVELPPPLPLPVNQFTTLLSMLAILHTRIKTTYPSRFLSTTLQAILASFSSAVSHHEEMILATVQTVKSIGGIRRPALPSRKSSGMLATAGGTKSSTSAKDPEADSAVSADPEEVATQTRLLQSFITHIFDEYTLNLPSYDDIPGMAWSSRTMETLHPERIVPHTVTLTSRFSHEVKLNRRIDALGQLVTLAQDLKVSDGALLAAATAFESVPDKLGGEEAPPSSAADIPLSHIGSLLLYTARQASRILHDRPQSLSPPFAIFPDHEEIIKHCLSSPAQGTGTLGTEPEALIDACLCVGLLALESDGIGSPVSDEQFTEYLQLTALLSSNCPNPNLRGHAHYLTSTLLRSHPDERVRLAFIRDTLEHCPFDNLKVSAVGWIKGEIIEANPPSQPDASANNQHHTRAGTPSQPEGSIFASPLALDSLAPFIFPSLKPELLTPPIQPAWTTFQANLSFYLAVLNFLYLLLSARNLHQALAVQDLWKDNDVAGSFLQPLREAGQRFGTAVESSDDGIVQDLGEHGKEEVKAQLGVLADAVERVTGAVRFLNE